MKKRNPEFSVPVATFNRIVSGEQTEFYRAYSEYWLKQFFLQRQQLKVITITTGSGKKVRSVQALLKGIDSKLQGRPEWDAPKGKVFVLYIDKLFMP